MSIDIKNKLAELFCFRFKPDIKTLYAFCLGAVSVLLGFLIILFNSHISFIIIRDVFQIGIIGLLFPFLLMAKNNEFEAAGLKFNKPLKYLLFSILLGALIIPQFIFADMSSIGLHSIIPAFYIMVASVFEIIFFFIFLRYNFEKAFGIIPAIILAAGFYSLHHAGFQPEFLKLFIVGLVFISIFRIANHWLICFPLWWIGALGDVLLRAENIADISNVSWIQIVIVAIALIGVFIIRSSITKRSIDIST